MSSGLNHLVLVTVSVVAIIVAAQSFQTTGDASGEKVGCWIQISGEQAINAIKESSKADPKKDIVRDDALESIELRLLAINWSEYLHGSGTHDHLYISSTPTGIVKPYWIVEYMTLLGMHNGNYGKYVVDAETGELMLALEDYFGPPGPGDFNMSFDPLIDFFEPFIIHKGETRTITIILTASPWYDASLPVTLEVTRVPKGISVTPSTMSDILRTNGTVIFKLDVSASPNAESLKYLPSLSGPDNWISIWFEFLSSGGGKSINVEIPES